MRINRRIVPAVCLVLGIASALALRVTDGQAGEPERKFTSVVFTGSLNQVGLAMTNAFGNGVYHRKHFFAPPYDFVIEGQKRISIPLTNAWMLCVSDESRLPLTLVPAGKKTVAYDEDFFIKAEAVGADSTRVSVRSEGSWVTEDRYGLSPHLVRVLGESYHPPLLSETTNVFCRIERQLAEIRVGSTNVLPPTLDTTPGFYLHFWMDMSDMEKHDRHNWERMVQAWKDTQEGHNPQGAPNGRQPSGSDPSQTSASNASRRSP
jgi:hypothetical protein